MVDVIKDYVLNVRELAMDVMVQMDVIIVIIMMNVLKNEVNVDCVMDIFVGQMNIGNVYNVGYSFVRIVAIITAVLKMYHVPNAAIRD